QMLADKARGAFPPLRGSAAVTERIDTLLAALLQPDPARRPDVEAVLRELRALRPKPTAPSDAATSLRSDGPFVGRTAELDTLRAAFAETQRGKAVTVLVSGPSGIGKSELVRRFLAEVERHAGTWVLRGRC